MNKKNALLLCLLLPLSILTLSCTGPVGPSGGYVMVFQDGISPNASYAGTEDTRIADSTYTTENFGAASNLVTGSTTTYKLHFLVKFDLSSVVPATASVDKAYLTLYTGSTIFGAFNVTAYPVTEDWDEGTAAVLADADDGATWTNRKTALTWGTPGGTRNDSKHGSSAAVPAGTMQPVTISIDPATVESWIANSAANYGVLVIGSKESVAADNYTSFFTSDYVANPQYRPKLTVYLKP